MQEGGALATQRSWTVYLQTERKQVLSVRADPGPDCSFMRENDINRTSFHIHSSLINPISHSKEKSPSRLFLSWNTKRPISTGNSMHMRDRGSSIMA